MASDTSCSTRMKEDTRVCLRACGVSAANLRYGRGGLGFCQVLMRLAARGAGRGANIQNPLGQKENTTT